MNTKDTIITITRNMFSLGGYEGISMRNLASASGITLSNFYHYFPSKDNLLEEIFHTTNTELGKKRQKLSKTTTASDMLRQIIAFQLDHAEEVVFVLKYYFTYRKKFKKNNNGFFPPKTYLHIEEVLTRGSQSGEFNVKNIYEESQVITHAINGFVLEYYPYKLTHKEKQQVIDKIYYLLIKALTNHEK